MFVGAVCWGARRWTAGGGGGTRRLRHEEVESTIWAGVEAEARAPGGQQVEAEARGVWGTRRWTAGGG